LWKGQPKKKIKKKKINEIEGRSRGRNTSELACADGWVGMHAPALMWPVGHIPIMMRLEKHQLSPGVGLSSWGGLPHNLECLAIDGLGHHVHGYQHGLLGDSCRVG